MAQLTFTLNGTTYSTSSEEVARKMASQEPEMVRTHGVKIEGRLFTVKQVIETITGTDRADYQSMQARSILRRLGFELVRLP